MITPAIGVAPFDGALAVLDTLRLVPADMLFRILCVVIVYALFTAGQRYGARSSLLRNIAVPLNLLVLVLLALVWLSPLLAGMHVYVLSGCAAFAAFLGTAIGAKLLDVFLFDLLSRVRQMPQVPVVVRDIARWAITLVALVLIVRAFFPTVNLNVLAVSSLVVGYVVGNATQDTLGNLIAGLALNTERPFQLGDWVTVSGHTGTVVDTTWRATRLRTRADDYVVIPNASIAREPIINFSRPTRHHGCYLSIGVDYATPPNKARAVILTVLGNLAEVCRDPAPSVFLVNYADFSINFSIKFFIEDYAALDSVQSLVMDRLWYAFKREGVAIPYPVQDVRVRDAVADEKRLQVSGQEDMRRLLGEVELFQSLSPAEFDRLVESVRVELFASREALFHEGDEGDTFCVLRAGQVSVSVKGAGGPVVVAHLGPGAFFGEMSLLTGEKRSATITAETDVEVLVVFKPVFSAILQSNTALADKLAVVLEKRAAANEARMTPVSTGKPVPPSHSAMVQRIRQFFGLS